MGGRGSPYERVQSEEIALHFILNSCLNGVVACSFLFPEIFLARGALWYALKTMPLCRKITVSHIYLS